MPSSREVFQLKPPTDTRLFTFDFAGDLAIGETIDDQDVDVGVFSGTDANPSAILSGVATASGSQVFQLITGGEVGVQYRLVCEAETSEGQILTRSAYLTILREAAV